MADSTAPDHTPLARELLADAYWHLISTLRLTLPPPFEGSPEALRKRDHAIIARIAGLAPDNAAEADVAAQFVAASEHWKNCLRLPQATDATWELVAKCRGAPNRPPDALATGGHANALAMMRQANSALGVLHRMQEARRKREADPAARDRAARAEHAAIRLMMAALDSQPPAPLIAAHPDTVIAEPAPEPQPAQQPTAPPQPDLAAAERSAATWADPPAPVRRTDLLSGVRYFNGCEATPAPPPTANPSTGPTVYCDCAADRLRKRFFVPLTTR